MGVYPEHSAPLLRFRVERLAKKAGYTKAIALMQTICRYFPISINGFVEK